jgi:hypothetical protein
MPKPMSYDPILRSKDPDVDKLAKLFDAITRMYVTEYDHQLQVLQALGDDENRLKELIKLGMMQHARAIFADAFRQVTGRKAWDE